jgi:hypothetical protein
LTAICHALGSVPALHIYLRVRGGLLGHGDVSSPGGDALVGLVGAALAAALPALLVAPMGLDKPWQRMLLSAATLPAVMGLVVGADQAIQAAEGGTKAFAAAGGLAALLSAPVGLLGAGLVEMVLRLQNPPAATP